MTLPDGFWYHSLFASTYLFIKICFELTNKKYSLSKIGLYSSLIAYAIYFPSDRFQEMIFSVNYEITTYAFFAYLSILIFIIFDMFFHIMNDIFLVFFEYIPCLFINMINGQKFHKKGPFEA